MGIRAKKTLIQACIFVILLVTSMRLEARNYIPIEGQADLFEEWANFQPAGVSPSDPFLEVSRKLAPLLSQTMVHDSDFNLMKDDVNSIGLIGAGDFDRLFSGKSLQRVAPDIGWVEVSIDGSQLVIMDRDEFGRSSKYKDQNEALSRAYPELMSRQDSRIAVLIVDALTFGGDRHLIQFPLLETADGAMYLLPQWFMAGDVVSSIRVNPETVDPEVRERLERRVAEQQRQIAAQTQPVETRRAQPTSYSRYLIWGGIVCLVLGVFFVLVRRSQTA